MAVYLFVDESRNLDFTESGSRYYAFGALATRTPMAVDTALTTLRYELIHEGTVLECFHATDDRQAVRDRVFACLREVGAFTFDALISDKRYVATELRNGGRFYPLYAAHLLAAVFAHYPDAREPIVIVTDRLPVKRDQATAAKAFKGYVRHHLGSRAFSLVHHASAAHGALQAADYCMWAVYRKWARGDERSYDLIRPFVLCGAHGGEKKTPQLSGGEPRGRAPWALVTGGTFACKLVTERGDGNPGGVA